MNKTGPIIIIEDDKEDCEIIKTVHTELDIQNELILFTEGMKAFEFLKQENVRPFLIISDVNMQTISGLELRAMIHSDEDLRIKCIPYLFFTSGDATSQLVTTAYTLSIQGFFSKPNSYIEFKNLIEQIVGYWKLGISPGRFKV